MDNTIYEVYRIYSVDDEYIETLLIYNGNYQNSNNFIKDYLSKLNNIFISSYYDRIYIVKNKEELEYIDDYIDVKYYKNKLNKNKLNKNKLNNYVQIYTYFLINIFNKLKLVITKLF
jgi:hypothetical protein